MSCELSQEVQDVDAKPLWSQPENTQRTSRDGSVDVAWKGKAKETGRSTTQRM